MTNRLYLDIHVLQTVPPSCINRDDTGSPKTAIYGGVPRARVSSQAWKKAVRDYFKSVGQENGIRTKFISDLIADKIGGDRETAVELANKILKSGSVTTNEDKNSKGHFATGALFFMSKAQINSLAELAKEDKLDKKLVQEKLNENPAVDMALFGRMVADDGSLNIDASCQVAHAISTHKITNEYDYFTAVDENKPKEVTDAGAGMIGTVEYNSSTLYRYATVALHELNKQLGKDPEQTAAAAAAFIKAFVLSMPTGKQNTFANQTPPYAVYVALRNDQPANFAGAFETAVKIKDESGYAENSATALTEYANKIYADWLDKPEKDYSVGNIEIGEKVNFKDMSVKIEEEIKKFDFTELCD